MYPQSGLIDLNAHVSSVGRQIVILTRLLDGKEICVINGTDELSKEQIEEKVLEHSAKLVQNPMSTTFCVIVGNHKTVKKYTSMRFDFKFVVSKGCSEVTFFFADESKGSCK